MKKVIKVVGAIFVNDKDEIFCAKRPMEKAFGGLWEFPGGKIENNESPQQALEREIWEELNIKIKANDIFINVEKEYEDFIINLTCINCDILDFSSFKLTEHLEYRWVSRKDILNIPWVPTDIPIVEKLSLA